MSQNVETIIVTATDVETEAVLATFSSGESPRTSRVTKGRQTYFNLGPINGKITYLVETEMGSGSLGASSQTVSKAIESFHPSSVIMVGIAYGTNQQKQKIGDVLVSQRLCMYELQRVGELEGQLQILPRNDRPHATPRLINLLRSAKYDWKDAKVYFGLIFTGEKLIDNPDFLKRLLEIEPEAIGGEMEGAGLYTSCHDMKTDWVLVKGICDWASNKIEDKEVRQKIAAQNAASFVYHALTCDVDEDAEPEQSMAGTAPLYEDVDPDTLSWLAFKGIDFDNLPQTSEIRALGWEIKGPGVSEIGKYRNEGWRHVLYRLPGSGGKLYKLATGAPPVDRIDNVYMMRPSESSTAPLDLFRVVYEVSDRIDFVDGPTRSITTYRRAIDKSTLAKIVSSEIKESSITITPVGSNNPMILRTDKIKGVRFFQGPIPPAEYLVGGHREPVDPHIFG